jgi:hypothetical protein
MDTDGGWHAEISFQCENKDVNVETVGYYKNMAEAVVALMKLVVGKHGGGNDEENSGQAGNSMGSDGSETVVAPTIVSQ